VLAGVTIEAASPALIGGASVQVTNEQGLYRYDRLPVGIYRFAFSIQGFGTSTREGVRVELGRTIDLDATLSLSAVEENVMVSAASPVVDAYWQSGEDERLFITRGEYLEALHPKTGKPFPDFGAKGRVNLHVPDNPWARKYVWTGAPVIVGNVVILSGCNGNQDAGTEREGVTDNIRGFDVRTGRLRWTFHVVPHPGEFGSETWGNDSWAFSGALNAWGASALTKTLGTSTSG
jgi:hypothetical protein